MRSLIRLRFALNELRFWNKQVLHKKTKDTFSINTNLNMSTEIANPNSSLKAPKLRNINVSKAAKEIKIPTHTKSEAKNIKVEESLPHGIVLTGGEKLRRKQLTGKGVKVAVIDSGVDAEHDGFEGKVTHQSWFRWGTPLEEDDHGTHVAGTFI
jgi:subtilisin family serine protease